jgi:hypothetical protein
MNRHEKAQAAQKSGKILVLFVPLCGNSKQPTQTCL